MRSTGKMGDSLPRVTLTGYQALHLLKRPRMPWGTPPSYNELYTVARRNDGSYWIEARGSGSIFWMSRWYEISKAAGERIFAFDRAVERLLQNDGSTVRAFGTADVEAHA